MKHIEPHIDTGSQMGEKKEAENYDSRIFLKGQIFVKSTTHNVFALSF